LNSFAERLVHLLILLAFSPSRVKILLETVDKVVIREA